MAESEGHDEEVHETSDSDDESNKENVAQNYHITFEEEVNYHATIYNMDDVFETLAHEKDIDDNFENTVSVRGFLLAGMDQILRNDDLI